MPIITFKCPSCATRAKMSLRAGQSSVKCKGCETVFPVDVNGNIISENNPRAKSRTQFQQIARAERENKTMLMIASGIVAFGILGLGMAMIIKSSSKKPPVENNGSKTGGSNSGSHASSASIPTLNSMDEDKKSRDSKADKIGYYERMKEPRPVEEIKNNPTTEEKPDPAKPLIVDGTEPQIKPADPDPQPELTKLTPKNAFEKHVIGLDWTKKETTDSLRVWCAEIKKDDPSSNQYVNKIREHREVAIPSLLEALRTLDYNDARQINTAADFGDLLSRATGQGKDITSPMNIKRPMESHPDNIKNSAALWLVWWSENSASFQDKIKGK